MEEELESRWLPYLQKNLLPEKWVLVADVAKNLTSYTDTGLNASTKYVYTVRPYKKGGNVKYMSAVKLSNKASTPAAPKVTPSGDISNSSVISNTRFTAAQKDVMTKNPLCGGNRWTGLWKSEIW